MAIKKSYLFYRNPQALKELRQRLRAEGEFKPVQNKPDAVRAEVKRLQARIEANTAALNQAG